MKYNKIMFLFLMLFLMTSLCGCVKVQEMTEEQSDLVAEYSAGVLLRYSYRYDRRLVTKDQLAKENQDENGAGNTITSEATVTPEITPTPQPAASGDTASGSGVDGQQTAEHPTVALNDVYHMEGLDFSYQSYQFCKKYSTQITAEKGQTLLVVEFNVKNRSGKKQKVNLGKRNISYQLTVDGSEYQPTISILSNMGLNFLNTTIPSGKTEKAVLIYRMSEERKQASEITLSVEDGDKVSIVKIKE